MNINETCIECIINQSVKVSNAIKADNNLSHTLTSTVKDMSKNFSLDQTPPDIAADVYQKMAELAQKDDLYDEIKELSTKKALSLVPQLKQRLQHSNNKLLTATKIAVAGNVIDLAAAVEFDLDEELKKIFYTNFDIDNFSNLQQQLSKAKKVVILGDNVGEHIFDYIFIETLKDLYPNTKYHYLVRGTPIINDVTIKEAKEAGFDKLCSLIDSGVNTPGFSYNKANTVSQELFNSADLIISKGMGNYECLTPISRKNICFLLKIKCDVVANSLNGKVGDIVCKLV